MLSIKRANIDQLGELVPLFDAYRVFYGQPSDIKAAKLFLTTRLSNDESIIFLAYWNEDAIGFTQLYTTFSSVSLQPFYILNDLFVNPKFRGKGIASELLEKAKAHCSRQNYKGLALETATDNPAQKLYERLDWKKDTAYLHYFWSNPNCT